MSMRTTIRKWGTSLGIRIPNVMVKDLKLEGLPGQINGSNLHGEVKTNGPLGKEAW